MSENKGVYDMKKIICMVITIIMVISLAGCGAKGTAENQPINTQKMNTEQMAAKPVDELHTYTINGERQKVTPYYPIEDNYVMNIVEVGYSNFHIYDSRNVTGEMLTNRTESDKIIVERVIAIITNKERKGDAKVLNTNGNYTYISYYGTDLDYTTGTIMITYLMYNPETDYEDDIIERYDYVLDRNFED